MISNEKESLEWCQAHKGSLWKLKKIVNGIERNYYLVLLVELNEMNFCLISDIGNIYWEPMSPGNMKYYLTHGRIITRYVKHEYECIQTKINYDKLLTPAYQVLFTKGD